MKKKIVQLLCNINPAGHIKQRVFVMKRGLEASISQKFKVWHMPKPVEEAIFGDKRKRKDCSWICTIKLCINLTDT